MNTCACLRSIVYLLVCLGPTRGFTDLVRRFVNFQGYGEQAETLTFREQVSLEKTFQGHGEKRHFSFRKQEAKTPTLW